MGRRKFLALIVVLGAMATIGGAVGYPYLRGLIFPRTTTTAGTGYPLAKRAIRIRPLSDNSVWELSTVNGAPQNWTAEQILPKINSLKPDLLERYITGYQNPSAQVPVDSGSPPMTVQQFLQASVNSTNNGIIIPRISLDEYDKGTLFQTSQNLLSFPLNPSMTLLSLDNWAGFASTHSQQQIVNMFSQLYSQGWKGIGVNDAGGYSTAYGYSTWADINTSVSTWQPNSSQLQGVKGDSSIKGTFLYIDFPNTMKQFAALTSADQQADILTNLASLQAQDGYKFVYPLVQGFWDSTLLLTSSTGKYGGSSLYTVMAGLMQQYN